jgi:DNA-binding beta-propeller fold protein YncE
MRISSCARALAVIGVAVALAPAPAGAVPLPGKLHQLANPDDCLGSNSACKSANAIDVVQDIAISPDGANVYAVGSALVDAITTMDRTPGTGVLVQKAATDGCTREAGSATCADGLAMDDLRAVAVAPDGRHVYAVADASDSVLAFRRDADGTLTQLTPATDACVAETNAAGCTDGFGLDGAKDLVVSPDGRDVYVIADDSDAVTAFTREGVSGVLTQKAGATGCIAEAPAGATAACFDGRALVNPSGIAISPDGRDLYVTGETSDSVVHLVRDLTTGGITQPAGPSGCAVDGVLAGCAVAIGLDQAAEPLVSPDGSRLLVAARAGVASVSDGGTVTTFDRASGTGALRQPDAPDGCISQTGSAGQCAVGPSLSSPAVLAIDPGGDNVYVANSGSAFSVVSLDRSAGGVLSQRGAAVACHQESGGSGCIDGNGLRTVLGLVVTPDGANVYAGADGAGGGFGDIAEFRRDRLPACGLLGGAVPHNRPLTVASCSDPDGDALTLAAGAATGGTATVGTATVTYRPTAGFAGPGTLAWDVTADGETVADAASVVVAPGVAPTCATQGASVTQGVATPLVLACDADGDPFTGRAVVTPPAHGTLGPIDPATGTATYTPAAGFTGTDGFTYGATTAFGTAPAAAFTIQVVPQQAGPQGGAGPAGAAGPPGVQGAPGPAGAAADRLFLAAVDRRLRSRRGRAVTLRYVATAASTVTLEVRRGKVKVATVRGRAKPGSNTIRWNGKQGRRAAARGAYKLTLTAVAGRQRATTTTPLTVSG